MSAKGWVWTVILMAGISALVLWAIAERNAPRSTRFAKVAQGTIVNSISTNGRVEPIDWASARAELAGAVVNILVSKGQTVEKGAPLVEQDASQARSALAAAQARIAQAQATLTTLSQGGRPAELAEIDGSLAAQRQEQQEAQRDYDALVRLQAKQAATAEQVAKARDRVARARLQIQTLQQRRAALVAPADKSVAEASLNEAEASAAAARDQIERSTIRAPMTGAIFTFDLRQGAYLNPGDLVANVGRLDKVRVTVYVDEPELGRVKVGMPVMITWTAVPGHEWKGSVEKLPTQIQALGTRQVGEVPCVIDNPGHDLLPDANVDVEIRTRAVEDALIVPKEAIRNGPGGAGVYLLEGDHVTWRNVTVGVTSILQAQVTGLKEGDAVALGVNGNLHDGLKVVPSYNE